MLETHGHVTVNERTPNQRFLRFVDEKIKDWIHNNELGDYPAEYEVAFFDEDPLGEISCLVVVQAGEQLWRSWETADNPRMALKRSLENLRPEKETSETEENQTQEVAQTH